MIFTPMITNLKNLNAYEDELVDPTLYRRLIKLSRSLLQLD